MLMFLQTTLVSEFLLYTLQVSVHSPVRRHSWFFSILWYVNNLLHTSQKYAFSPVHIHSGAFIWHETINDFLNILQLHDRFPLCKCCCSFRVAWTVNLLHKSHVYGVFSGNSSCVSYADSKEMNYYIHNCYTHVIQYLRTSITSEYPEQITIYYKDHR